MNDQKPFNDVIEHMENIEGSVPNKVRFGGLPLPIKIIGGFLAGFVGLGAAGAIIGSVFFN